MPINFLLGSIIFAIKNQSSKKIENWGFIFLLFVNAIHAVRCYVFYYMVLVIFVKVR